MSLPSFEQFKAFARATFAHETLDTTKNPIDALYALDWVVPFGPAFNENDIALFNINLDQRGCFGRIVRAAVLVEKFFPKSVVMTAEVLNDALRSLLLQQVESDKVLWNDPTFIAELLQYENPHTCLEINGKQFDPLFKTIGNTRMQHPAIMKHSLWEGMYSAYLVSIAHLQKSYTVKELILQKALEVCPEMILVKENLASNLLLADSDWAYRQTVGLLEEVIKSRKDAKLLFVLYLLTKNDTYRQKIISEYHENVFVHLKNQYPDAV